MICGGGGDDNGSMMAGTGRGSYAQSFIELYDSLRVARLHALGAALGMICCGGSNGNTAAGAGRGSHTQKES